MPWHFFSATDFGDTLVNCLKRKAHEMATDSNKVLSSTNVEKLRYFFSCSSGECGVTNYRKLEGRSDRRADAANIVASL